MNPGATLLAAAALAGPGGRPPLSIDDVLARPSELHGKTIEVRGWLGECAGYICSLYPDQQSALAGDFNAPQLAIGPRGNFDLRTVRYRYAEIVLRARFDQTCLVPVCTDRASVLDPIRIVRVLQPAPRTPNPREQ